MYCAVISCSLYLYNVVAVVLIVQIPSTYYTTVVMFGLNHGITPVGSFNGKGLQLEEVAHIVRSRYECEVIANLRAYCNMDDDCQSIVMAYIQLDNMKTFIANVIAVRLQMERKHWHMRRDMERERSAHELNGRCVLNQIEPSQEGPDIVKTLRNTMQRQLDYKLRELYVEFTLTKRHLTDMLELACCGTPIIADTLAGTSIAVTHVDDHFIDGWESNKFTLPRLQL